MISRALQESSETRKIRNWIASGGLNNSACFGITANCFSEVPEQG